MTFFLQKLNRDLFATSFLVPTGARGRKDVPRLLPGLKGYQHETQYFETYLSVSATGAQQHQEPDSQKATEHVGQRCHEQRTGNTSTDEKKIHQLCARRADPQRLAMSGARSQRTSLRGPTSQPCARHADPRRLAMSGARSQRTSLSGSISQMSAGHTQKDYECQGCSAVLYTTGNDEEIYQPHARRAYPQKLTSGARSQRTSLSGSISQTPAMQTPDQTRPALGICMQSGMRL